VRCVREADGRVAPQHAGRHVPEVDSERVEQSRPATRSGLGDYWSASNKPLGEGRARTDRLSCATGVGPGATRPDRARARHERHARRARLRSDPRVGRGHRTTRRDGAGQRAVYVRPPRSRPVAGGEPLPTATCRTQPPRRPVEVRRLRRRGDRGRSIGPRERSAPEPKPGPGCTCWCARPGCSGRSGVRVRGFTRTALEPGVATRPRMVARRQSSGRSAHPVSPRATAPRDRARPSSGRPERGGATTGSRNVVEIRNVAIRPIGVRSKATSRARVPARARRPTSESSSITSSRPTGYRVERRLDRLPRPRLAGPGRPLPGLSACSTRHSSRRCPDVLRPGFRRGDVRSTLALRLRHPTSRHRASPAASRRAG